MPVPLELRSERLHLQDLIELDSDPEVMLELGYRPRRAAWGARPERPRVIAWAGECTALVPEWPR